MGSVAATHRERHLDIGVSRSNLTVQWLAEKGWQLCCVDVVAGDSCGPRQTDDLVLKPEAAGQSEAQNPS